MSEGRKEDGAKAPYHLIAPELLEGVAEALGFGQHKYAARNWEEGMAWHRPFSAMMRHMWAWWRGEDKDPETGLSHLAHAACCVMFLMAYEKRMTGDDDRPPILKVAEPDPYGGPPCPVAHCTDSYCKTDGCHYWRNR